MDYYSCDFEANNSKIECRVWLYGIWNIFTEQFYYGRTINDFYNTVCNLAMHDNIMLSFHNLKFDGEFLLIYLMKQGYQLVKESKQKLKGKEFRTLISDMGVWYCIEFNTRYDTKVKIVNTLCLFPFKLGQLAKAFGLEEEKGSIDYDYVRPEWHVPTQEEVEYLRKDCVIAGRAWKYNIEHNDVKMTVGSNALSFFKKMTTKKKMEHNFPKLEIDEDTFVRGSYRGGWVYVNQKYKGKDVGEGRVYDVNSLFPSRMKFELMPYGRGVFYEGKYQGDNGHPLYVQRLQCSFEIKKGKLPTIQLKHTMGFHKTEYCTSTHGEVVELTLTSVDLALFLDHYKVKDLYYLDGYKYKATYGIFDEYIDYWMDRKKEAEREDNKPQRTIAKLKLNSLYGKFAKRPKGRPKWPELHGDCLKLVNGDEEDQDTLYIPVGTFITAYARNYTIRAAHKNYKRFLYADTDSLHLLGLKDAEGIEVDKYELGKWKPEATFKKAKYLGAKCYCEAINVSRETLIDFLRENPMMYSQVNWHDCTLLDIKCAGLPDGCKAGIDFEKFREGLEVEDKLFPRHVPNGIMLEKGPYKIKPR